MAIGIGVIVPSVCVPLSCAKAGVSEIWTEPQAHDSEGSNGERFFEAVVNRS